MMNDINELLDSAFDDYNNGLYTLAEQKARDALIISPSHGDCFYLLGLIAYKKGIFVQAIDLLNLAVKVYPKQKNYQLALAEVYQHHGDFEKAIAIYQLFSDMLNVQAQLGWIAIAQKEMKQAKEIFNQLIKSEIAYAGYHGLAFCCGEKNKLKYLKKSFGLNPHSVIAKDIVHYLLEKSQVGELKKYLDYLNDDLLLSQCFVAQKQYLKAFNKLQDEIQQNPYNLDAILLIAHCAENLKDLEKAQYYYQMALSLDKNNLQAHKSMGRLMMKQAKLPLAIDHYQIVLRKNNQDTQALLALATIQEGLGVYDEALGLYFRLLTLKCNGLNGKIKNCIENLYSKNKKLAKRFAKGWLKNYPENKTAQKLVKTLGCFLLIITFCLPVKAENFSNDLNWDLAWIGKMAEMGDAASQYELALMFEKGIGMPQNISRAVHYYQLAAKQQHFPSMLKLGQIFADENGYNDPEKSLQWYIYAAQNGEVQAQLYLADYYQNEKQDNLQAKFWLEKALKQLFPNEEDLTKVSPDYERLKNGSETKG